MNSIQYFYIYCRKEIASMKDKKKWHKKPRCEKATRLATVLVCRNFFPFLFILIFFCKKYVDDILDIYVLASYFKKIHLKE